MLVWHEAILVGTHPVWIDHGVNPYKSSFQVMSDWRANGGRIGYEGQGGEQEDGRLRRKPLAAVQIAWHAT